MTSFRQITANRLNALKSTGPRTEEGKQQSHRNAFRHGLTAETVIDGLEDVEDYKAFEAAIIADYDVHTAVERELVLRLASLLWRLRRATAIETDLLRIQAEILCERQHAAQAEPGDEQPPDNPVYPVRSVAVPPRLRQHPGHSGAVEAKEIDDSSPGTDAVGENSVDPSRTLTYCFLRLANLDKGVFKRLTRYEAALWRQTVQTLFALRAIRHM